MLFWILSILNHVGRTMAVLFFASVLMFGALSLLYFRLARAVDSFEYPPSDIHHIINSTQEKFHKFSGCRNNSTCAVVQDVPFVLPFP
jgi:hypothetical protein